MAKRALITGVTGQDGAYLTEFLLGKGYEVHGLLRRASLFNTDRIDHLYHDPHLPGVNLALHYGDLSDGTALRRVLEKVRPDEVYNLAAQSHVKVSFEVPEYTADVVAMGTLRLLDALRDYIVHGGNAVRCYQAGSSEMYGAAPAPQSERTPFYPRSPYAVSKVAAHWYAINYREAYDMFICNGILFNHESPRRGETFVTRKVTRAAARIKEGLQDKLYLGNLDAKRDWGFAGEAPIALGVEIAKVELVLQAFLDARGGARHLARHEGLAAARALMIEEDAVADEHIIGLAVIDGVPMRRDLAHRVRRARIERRALALRRRGGAVHLGRARLIAAHGIAAVHNVIAERIE